MSWCRGFKTGRFGDQGGLFVWHAVQPVPLLLSAAMMANISDEELVQMRATALTCNDRACPGDLRRVDPRGAS